MITKGYRPEDHQQRSIRHWQTLVKPDDTTIHLGDVIMGDFRLLPDILAQLPGYKRLVPGNHDHRRKGFLEAGFDTVDDAIAIPVPGRGDVLLTHAPAASLWPGMYLNVHGHMHDDLHRVEEGYPQPWHRLLAIEFTDYAPVLFHEFIQTEGHYGCITDSMAG
jgi:calcineurin-like phosphoesterase family protein